MRVLETGSDLFFHISLTFIPGKIGHMRDIRYFPQHKFLPKLFLHAGDVIKACLIVKMCGYCMFMANVFLMLMRTVLRLHPGVGGIFSPPAV